MCQELVKEFLCQESNQWFTIREISEGTGLSLNSTFDNCKMLRKRNLVFYKVERRFVGHAFKDVIVYKFKRC